MRFVYIFCCFFALCNPVSANDVIQLKRSDGKTVPVKLYGSWMEKGCPDTIILSHGLGGNEKGLSFLGEAFAEKGYRVAVMGHTNVDELGDLRKLIWGGGAANSENIKLVVDPEKFRNRFWDLEATYKYVTRDCRPKHLYMGGHSLGAATTMVEAGAVANVPQRGSDRFDAYIALSPQGTGPFFNEGAWDKVKKPVLMVTGTKDTAMGKSYETRLTAFEGLPQRSKRLAVIKGANHLNLGGLGGWNYQRITVSVMDEFLKQVQNGSFEPSQIAKGVVITDK